MISPTYFNSILFFPALHKIRATHYRHTRTFRFGSYPALQRIAIQLVFVPVLVTPWTDRLHPSHILVYLLTAVGTLMPMVRADKPGGFHIR